MIEYDLHGMTLDEVREQLESKLSNAYEHGESVIRIIHGQGKHSEVFPVLKSYVRHWLETSKFAAEHIESVFRGEDGSPYTAVNAGETVIVFRNNVPTESTISWEDEEDDEARRRVRRLNKQKRRR